MFGPAGGKENVASGNVRRPLHQSNSNSNVKSKIAQFGNRNRSQSPSMHQPKNNLNKPKQFEQDKPKRPSLFGNVNRSSSRSQSPAFGNSNPNKNAPNNSSNTSNSGNTSGNSNSNHATSNHTPNSNSNNPLLNRSGNANNPFQQVRGGGGGVDRSVPRKGATLPEPSQEIEAYIRESFIKALEQPGADKARAIGETVDVLLKQVGDREKEAPTRACIFHRAVLSFTPHGELAQYVNNEEYIGYCLRLATTIGTYNVYESEHIFRTLKDQRVGRHDARFYCEWAKFALAQSLPDKAHKVISKGIQVGAQPKNLLDEMLVQIQSDRESPSEPVVAQTPGPGGANPLSRFPSTPAAGMGRPAQGRGGFLCTPAAKGKSTIGANDLNTPGQHTNTNIGVFGNTPSMHGTGNRPPRPPLAPMGGASGSGAAFGGGESSLTNGLGMGMTNEVSMSSTVGGGFGAIQEDTMDSQTDQRNRNDTLDESSLHQMQHMTPSVATSNANMHSEPPGSAVKPQFDAWNPGRTPSTPANLPPRPGGGKPMRVRRTGNFGGPLEHTQVGVKLSPIREESSMSAMTNMTGNHNTTNLNQNTNLGNTTNSGGGGSSSPHETLTNANNCPSTTKKNDEMRGSQDNIEMRNNSKTEDSNPSQPSVPMDPSTHKILYVNGRPYRRIEELGRGGSSKVYKVADQNGCIFALKRVNCAGDPSVMQTFIGEVELLKKLAGKPRIIRAFDSEVLLQKNRLLILMEYGEMDLAKFCTQNKATCANIRQLWRQMLESVSIVHAERIVHGDLKPANFLLVNGQVKLIDFGIACGIESGTTNIHRDSPMGTISYMAPETLTYNPSAAGHKTSRAADIWALGIILYQLVYSHTPWSGANKNVRVNLITSPDTKIEFPAIPTRLEPSNSDEALLLDTLKGCLRYDKEDRYTMKDLLGHGFLREDGAYNYMFMFRKKVESQFGTPLPTDVDSVLKIAEELDPVLRQACGVSSILIEPKN